LPKPRPEDSAYPELRRAIEEGRLQRNEGLDHLAGVAGSLRELSEEPRVLA
jgi:hypothetical protein